MVGWALTRFLGAENCTTTLITIVSLVIPCIFWYRTLRGKRGQCLLLGIISFFLFLLAYLVKAALAAFILPWVACGIIFHVSSGSLEHPASNGTSGEAAPSSPGWTSIQGSGNSGIQGSGNSGEGGSEASVNQPFVIPEHPPLLDDHTREDEIRARLGILRWAVPYNEGAVDSVVQAQLQIERRIEEALVNAGYSPESVFYKRHEIRGILFYPNGEVLAPRTYYLHLRQIENKGLEVSTPYKSICRSLRNYHLFLDRVDGLL